jgi:hypothetical protein
MRAQSIHQHYALANQPLPTSVQQHSGLLFSRLGRHEAWSDSLGPPGDLGRGEGTVSEKLGCLESVGEAEGNILARG